MKKIILIFSLFFLFINYTKSQNSVSIMSISGKYLKQILSNFDSGIVVLKFQTDDGTNFYANGFVYSRTTEPYFDKLPLYRVADVPIPQNEYCIGTLVKKFKELKIDQIDTSDNYLLVPYIDVYDNCSQILYSRPIPTSKVIEIFKSEISNIQGIKDLKDLDYKNQKEALLRVYQALKAATGNFNPIPPRLVP